MGKLDDYQIATVCDTWDYDARECVESTEVYQLPDHPGYFFVSDLQIDLDGSPRAYHPDDKKKPDNHTQALDWMTSVNVRDLHGIQGVNATGPRKGYYVSGTSAYWSKYPENDTRRWVDAEVIPYYVLTLARFPANKKYPAAETGDVGIVFDLKTGALTAAMFADEGRAVGEVSVKLAQNLGFDPTVAPNTKYPPKVQSGQDRKDFFYLVFPGSAVSPPWSEKKITDRAMKLFKAWGGVDQIKDLFPRRALWKRS